MVFKTAPDLLVCIFGYNGRIGPVESKTLNIYPRHKKNKTKRWPKEREANLEYMYYMFICMYKMHIRYLLHMEYMVVASGIWVLDLRPKVEKSIGIWVLGYEIHGPKNPSPCCVPGEKLVPVDP